MADFTLSVGGGGENKRIDSSFSAQKSALQATHQKENIFVSTWYHPCMSFNKPRGIRAKMNLPLSFYSAIACFCISAIELKQANLEVLCPLQIWC